MSYNSFLIVKALVDAFNKEKAHRRQQLGFSADTVKFREVPWPALVLGPVTRSCIKNINTVTAVSWPWTRDMGTGQSQPKYLPNKSPFCDSQPVSLFASFNFAVSEQNYKTFHTYYAFLSPLALLLENTTLHTTYTLPASADSYTCWWLMLLITRRPLQPRQHNIHSFPQGGN